MFKSTRGLISLQSFFSMKFMIRNEFLMFHFGESVFFLGGFSSTNLGEFDSLTRSYSEKERFGTSWPSNCHLYKAKGAVPVKLRES